MTISLRAAGTVTTSGAAVTALSPAVPATATTGDLSILSVNMKPYSATINTPSGWTKISEYTNGTVASSTDLGSTKVAVFVKESASVGAIGNLTWGTAPDSASAVINTYAKTGTAWDYSAFQVGIDSTNAANYSATGIGGMGVQTGDWIVCSTSTNNDLGISGAIAMSFSGATLSASNNRTVSNTSIGNDSGLYVVDASVTAVTTSAGPPVFSYTATQLGSGTTLFLRLREISAPVGPVLAQSQMVKLDTNTNTNLVTAPFTWNAGDVFVVKNINASVGAPAIGTPTATGLTFTVKASFSTASKCEISIYTAVAASSGTSAITTVWSGSTGFHSSQIERWTNAALEATPASVSTSGSSVGPSATITTNGTNSAVTWASGDWSARAQGTIALRSSASLEGTTGGDTTTYTAYYAEQDAATAGSQTIGMTTPATSQNWSIAAIEIQAADPLYRWKIARAAVATTPAKILAIGDSVTEGQGASSIADRWVTKLRDTLRITYPSGAVGGPNYLPAQYHTYNPDSSWADWRTAETGTITKDTWAANIGWRSASFSTSATRTYTVTGTSVDIWWASNGGSFTYQIDGGTVSSAISTAGVYTTGNKTTVSLGASGSHTIKLACTAGTFYFEGFTVYDGDTTVGVQMFEGGHTSFTSTQWASGGADQIPAWQACDPDLAIIEIGLNDPGSAISTATFTTNLLTMINQLRSVTPTPPSILVLATYNPVTSFMATATWQTYVTAMANVAAQQNTAFLDLSALMPTATTAGTGFYSTDGLHPNNSGHIEIARLVNNTIGVADLTTVQKTSSTTWGVRASVAKTSSTNWGVKSAGSKTSATTWSVRSAIAKTSVTTWNTGSLQPFLVAEVESAVNTSTSPKTSPSLTVAVGDVLLITAFSAGDTAQGTLTTPTNTGTAFTWTLVNSVATAGYQHVAVWKTTATAGQTMTISVARSGSSGAFYGVNVKQWRNSSGIGSAVVANPASGAPTLNITTTNNNTAIDVAVVDWDAVDGSSRVWRTVNGSPATEDLYFRDAAQYGVYVGHYLDAGTAGSKTVGLSSPSNGTKYDIFATEVLGVLIPVTKTSSTTWSIKAVVQKTSTTTWNTNAIPPTALAEWGFTENGGPVAVDTIGGKVLSLEAAGWTSSGHTDWGLQQTTAGRGAYVAWANPTNAITLMAWYKPNIGALSAGGAQQILGFMDSVNNGNSEAVIWAQRNDFGTAGVLQGNIRASGLASAEGGSLTDNIWVHVAVTYDQNWILLYKDGVEVGSTSRSTSITAGTHFFVGSSNTGLTTYGTIDDVRVYDIALTPSQIVTMMAIPVVSGLTTVQKTSATTWAVLSGQTKTSSTTWAVRSNVVKTSSTTWGVRSSVTKTSATSWNVYGVVTPVGEWGFNDNTGTDSSGHGQNLTVIGSPSVAGGHTGNAATTGVTNRFEGAVGPGSLSTYTVMAWVKINTWSEPYRAVLSNGSNFYFEFSTTSGNMYIECYSGNGTFPRGQIGYTTAGSLGQWVHVATTRNADGTTKVFANGVEVGSGFGNAIDFSSTAFEVGSYGDGTQYLLDGLIDDLRVFDASMDATAVSAWKDIPVGSSTTTVQKTSATTWNIAQTLQKTNITTWAVAQSIQKTSATNWAVRSGITKTSISNWAVQQSISKTSATNWSVRAPVVKTSATNWAVSASVLKTSVTTWAVRSSLVKTSATNWGVLSGVSKTSLTNWAVASKITKTSITNWAVRASVTKTSATAWVVIVTDAVVTRTEAHLTPFAIWCANNGVLGAIGEFGIMNETSGAELPKWNNLGYAYLDMLRRTGLTGIEWAASRVFGDTDPQVVVAASDANYPNSADQEMQNSGPIKNAVITLPLTRGINLAGGEFAAANGTSGGATLPSNGTLYSNVNPGTHNADYGYPVAADWAKLSAMGIKLVRLPFSWERIQNSLNGTLNATEVTRIQGVLSDAASNGISVILDCHNYAQYYLGTSPTARTILYLGGTGATLQHTHLTDLWTKINTAFSGSSNIVAYDLMNEPAVQDNAGTYVNDTQAVDNWKTISANVVSALRTAGVTKTLIVSGWWGSPPQTWVTKHGSTPWITDSLNNTIYSAHQYFDGASDEPHSGTYYRSDGYTYAKELALAEASSVIKTSDTSWNVIGRVQKTSSTIWSVKGSVAKTSATIWAVRTGITKTSVTTWAVRNALTKTSLTNWSVLSPALKTNATNWSVRGLVPKTSITSWAVRSIGSKTSDTTWSIRNSLTNTSSTSWSVLNKVNKTNVTNWSVLTIGSKSISTTWAAVGRLQKTSATIWSVLSNITGGKWLPAPSNLLTVDSNQQLPLMNGWFSYTTTTGSKRSGNGNYTLTLEANQKIISHQVNSAGVYPNGYVAVPGEVLDFSVSALGIENLNTSADCTVGIMWIDSANHLISTSSSAVRAPFGVKVRVAVNATTPNNAVKYLVFIKSDEPCVISNTTLSNNGNTGPEFPEFDGSKWVAHSPNLMPVYYDTGGPGRMFGWRKSTDLTIVSPVNGLLSIPTNTIYVLDFRENTSTTGHAGIPISSSTSYTFAISEMTAAIVDLSLKFYDITGTVLIGTITLDKTVARRNISFISPANTASMVIEISTTGVASSLFDPTLIAFAGELSLPSNLTLPSSGLLLHSDLIVEPYSPDYVGVITRDLEISYRNNTLAGRTTDIKYDSRTLSNASVTTIWSNLVTVPFKDFDIRYPNSQLTQSALTVNSNNRGFANSNITIQSAVHRLVGTYPVFTWEDWQNTNEKNIILEHANLAAISKNITLQYADCKLVSDSLIIVWGVNKKNNGPVIHPQPYLDGVSDIIHISSHVSNPIRTESKVYTLAHTKPLR